VRQIVKNTFLHMVLQWLFSVLQQLQESVQACVLLCMVFMFYNNQFEGA
jgi:hypothetical protein